MTDKPSAEAMEIAYSAKRKSAVGTDWATTPQIALLIDAFADRVAEERVKAALYAVGMLNAQPDPMG